MLIAPMSFKAALSLPKGGVLHETALAAAAAGYNSQTLKGTTAFALKTFTEPLAIERFIAAATPLSDSSFLDQVRRSAAKDPQSRLSADDLVEGITPVQPDTSKHWFGSLERAIAVETARIAAESARPARTGPALEQAFARELGEMGVGVNDETILSRAQSTLRHSGEINAFTKHYGTNNERRTSITIGAFNSVPVGTKTLWLDAERALGRGGWSAT